DVDGDGLADVLETSPGTAQLRLHRQGKGGEILVPLAFPTLAGAAGTRIGDVDGDGKAEVVLLSADERSIGVSRWDGARLTFPRSVPLKAKPVNCDLSDLDGKPGAELAVAVDDEGKASILFFAAGEPLAQAGEPLELKGAKDPPDRIRFADADQDGRADLAAFFPYEPVRFYLQVPAAEGGLPAFTDVSAQKDFGRGLLQGAVAGSFTAGDLNGDGKAELFLAKKSFARAFRVTERKVLEVAEQFNARDPASEIAGVALGDFQGDGRPEIALLDKARSQLLLLARSEMGTYAVSSDIKVPAFAYRGIAAADMNADGRADLFIEGDDRFGILHAGGTEYRLKRLAEYEADLKDVWLDQAAAGDLDSDGRKDIAVTELRSHLLEILAQEGDGRGVQRRARFKVFEDGGHGGDGDEKKAVREPREIAVADVTGDGKQDLVLLIHDRLVIYPQE
ncbi:MAG: VCBS repeat-containing protein, partial [Planctomycetes bacterium]|nr:VCBS repeat-containing protein [Planctomycetota bacterium]